jgi:hypothetical protein
LFPAPFGEAIADFVAGLPLPRELRRRFILTSADAERGGPKRRYISKIRAISFT